MSRLLAFIIVASLAAVTIILVTDNHQATPATNPTEVSVPSTRCLIYRAGMCPSDNDGSLATETLNYGTTGDANAAAAAALAQLVEHITPTTTQPVRVSRETSAPNHDPGDGSRWDQLAQCEAGGNWATNTGNGFGGGLQFMHQRSYSTWLSFGGGEFAPHPWEATRDQQIVIAERVLDSSGWNAWPGCSRRLGYR
jgi:hypothetical protein